MAEHDDQVSANLLKGGCRTFHLGTACMMAIIRMNIKLSNHPNNRGNQTKTKESDERKFQAIKDNINQFTSLIQLDMLANKVPGCPGNNFRAFFGTEFMEQILTNALPNIDRNMFILLRSLITAISAPFKIRVEAYRARAKIFHNYWLSVLPSDF